MKIYRIVKSAKRAKDLSGMGAYKEGGRWNSPGTYMLYASENSSLAYLENLVHFEAEFAPPSLFIITLEVQVKSRQLYVLPDEEYPANWREIGNLENKAIGDRLMEDGKHLAVRVRSAVNPIEYNYLLNPLFPGYQTLVRFISAEELPVDARLIR